MAPQVEVIEPRSFATTVAEELVTAISEVCSEKDSCTLALPGGKTPGSVFRSLSRPPFSEDIDWNALHLFWGDERWVPHDDTQSNFRLAQETWLDHVSIPEANVHAIDTSAASPDKGAEAYKKTVTENCSLTDNGIPVFDIMLLGIGDGGHTASLFPGDPRLSDNASICYAASHPDVVDRVTLSAEVIRNAKRVYVIVNGEHKSELVKQVLSGSDSINDLPAKVFHECNGKVLCFLDSAAAKEL